MILITNDSALACCDPAPGPATTTLVFLDTLPATFAPSACSLTFASFAAFAPVNLSAQRSDPPVHWNFRQKFSAQVQTRTGATGQLPKIVFLTEKCLDVRSHNRSDIGNLFMISRAGINDALQA